MSLCKFFKVVLYGNKLEPKFTQQGSVIHSEIRHVNNSCIILPRHAPNIGEVVISLLQLFAILLVSLLLSEN